MRTAVTATVCALSVAALAACSSTSAPLAAPHHVPGHAASPAAHTSAAPSGSTKPSPYPTTSRATQSPTTTPSSPARDVDRVLLTAPQLGSDFTRAEDAPPSALPCTPDTPPVDDRVRHVEKSDAVYVDDVAGVQVSEQIYVYDSVAKAVQHEQIVEAGLACAKGRLDSTAVDIAGPTDIHGQLPERNDTAQAWVVESAAVSGVLVAVRIHAVVVQFAVVASKGTSSTLDAKQVVETGLQNILART